MSNMKPPEIPLWTPILPESQQCTPDPLFPMLTIRQVYTADAQAQKAQATTPIDVAYGQQFSDPVGNNTCAVYTDGKQYFAALIEALKGAKTEIMIAGWQINWDAMLAPGLRLLDVLLPIAQKSGAPKIYIMPWENPGAVETYAAETKTVFDDYNYVAKKDLFHTYLSPTEADEDEKFFSHHQKQVVIDRKIGFVGGIDLAYGRYDDHYFSLLANGEGRDGLDRYNPCVPPIGTMAAAEVDPDYLNGAIDNFGKKANETRNKINQGGLQGLKGGNSRTTTLDAMRQPRMPWQDLQQKIEGPAVENLAQNFILRWNIGAKVKIPAQALSIKHKPGKAGCSVQVLRSAANALRQEEYKAVAEKDLQQVYPLYSLKNKKPEIKGKQDDIARAWHNLIDNAQHFIYIENQFFNSAFGIPNPARGSEMRGPGQSVYDDYWKGANATQVMPGKWDGEIQNDLCRRIGDRIWRAITDAAAKPFHVYLVLPVHPEGSLNVGATITQIHWTMQSLVFGSESLVNRVRTALRSVKKPESDWVKYLTLLNLRNWALLGNNADNFSVVTEQIYVHTKLIIVDDRYVVHGSANINDRSMLGSRDSELAVLIHDSESELADLDGSGDKVMVLKHARKLRKEVWKKLFGLNINSSTSVGGAQSAKELASVIDKPAAPATVKAIQKVASKNTEIYEEIFDWIPRNKKAKHIEAGGQDSSIWPRWRNENPQNNIPGGLVGPMPFEEAFWRSAQVSSKKITPLFGIKGFITQIPLSWTNGENNDMKYHIRLIAEKNINKDDLNEKLALGKVAKPGDVAI